MAKEPVGNGEVQGGSCSPQDAARKSLSTETPKAPPAQPATTAASRTSRADAKYEELLGQAREIMANPEFMEEVMALARLKMKLRNEIGSHAVGKLLGIVPLMEKGGK